MDRMLGSVVEIDGLEVPAAEGARRATGEAGTSSPSSAAVPDPEVPAKVQRRRSPRSIGSASSKRPTPVRRARCATCGGVVAGRSPGQSTRA